MKLQDQVTSLELSKKLKELGVKQESYFYWTKTFSDDWELRDIHAWDERTSEGHLLHHDDTFKERAEESDGETDLAAFTVAELGELLPNKIHDKDGFSTWLMATKNLKDEWEVGYMRLNSFEDGHITDESLVEAAGKMLIYLIENKLLQTDQG